MVERPDYETLAQDINLEDITSCKGNAILLRKIRDGDPNWNKFLYIMNRDDHDDDDYNPDEDFVVAEGDDLGWLGYFIGRSEVIEDLHIYYLPEGGDEINKFVEGMSQNLSLKTFRVSNVIGVDGWSRLGNFVENNRNLECFEVEGFMIGRESVQKLALAFGRMHHNSLKHLSINDTGISDEGLTELVTGLRLHSHLEHLTLHNNNIGRSGCIALGNTLSRWPASNNLEVLNLQSNVIDDGGLQALVPGLMNCRSLKQLYLGGNRSITTAGLRYVTPLLQSESHSLEKLHLYNINFGDDGAIALAEGLRGNIFLEELLFDPETAGMTSVGWSAFSTLLCDSSTIDSTYLSNHTLTSIGRYGNDGTPHHIRTHLSVNEYRDAAISKILRSHPDLDMEPFFKLKMQFLPTVMSWFDNLDMEELCINWDLVAGFERSCRIRKLSALYKFVRAMPDLAVIGYWQGRVIDIEAKKRMLDEEEVVAWKRLGGRPIDDANKRKRIRHV
jgi:hypothetical protein